MGKYSDRPAGNLAAAEWSSPKLFLLPTVSTQWHIAGAGDFFATGKAGLVWENTATGQRAIWSLQNGALQSSSLLSTVSTDWKIVDH